nr:sensor histidine kinase [uncultured Eisenbergiella sp.]
MLKKARDMIQSWSFRKKIGVILVLFTFIPSILMQQLMMHFYEDHIIEKASRNIYSVVRANNNVLRMMLNQIEDISQLMLNNEYYYEVFSDFDSLSTSDLMRYDRRLETELARQFSTSKDVYEAYLFTSKWIFGDSGMLSTTLDGIERSGLLEKAEMGGGLPCWTAGYDYGKAVQSDYLIGKEDYSYRYPITMVRKMTFQYSFKSDYRRLSEKDENPVLFVYILEDSIRKVYEKSVEYKDSIYGISDENGIVISSDNESFAISQKLPEDIWKYYGKDGFSTCVLGNREYLVCYDTLEYPQWFSWVLVPMDTLIRDTLMQARLIQLVMLAILLVLSAVVASLLSKTISRPVGKLTKAARRVATGNFSADTPVPEGGDFRLLTESFNHMELEINRLIHENYEISLREKETQLMALAMQINPHFLYNTLNTINMLAIQNDDEETSDLIVSLSEMLQYTFKNRSEKILLSDEIVWTSNYIFIMAKRFGNMFTADIQIPSQLMQCRVPKFFLQPLVENAIIHGFEGKSEGGLLLVTACQEEEDIHFRISDNGKGTDAEAMKQHIAEAANDGGIGISNVHRRLVLIYGERYRVDVESEEGRGTCLHLYIPFEL